MFYSIGALSTMRLVGLNIWGVFPHWSRFARCFMAMSIKISSRLSIFRTKSQIFGY